MGQKKLTSAVDATHKKVKILNKSDKPNNIVLKQNDMLVLCASIESQLPDFFSDYFLYLRNAIALSSRVAYLRDLHFFCSYLVNEKKLVGAHSVKEISLEAFTALTAKDINLFLADYCTRYIKETENADYIIENHTRALARKRSSISVLFKIGRAHV